MIKAPSVNKLISELGITQEQAQTVRGLIKGTIEPDTVEATDRWIRQCHNRPFDSELIMHAIDATIETCGVECLGPTVDHRFTPAYSYCNTGDSYAATLIRNNSLGSYYIGCWATIAERVSRASE